jgi:hypothetical protein
MSDVESEKVVSVSSRGQATIPKQFREESGIDTPGRVKFIRRTSVWSAGTGSIGKPTHLEVVDDDELAVTRFPSLTATGPAAQYSIVAE